MKIKKALASFLSTALTLTALTSICAFSANAETDTLTLGGSVSQDVTFTEGNVSILDATVYSVDIVWTDVYFKYDSASSVWNPNTHTYTTSGESNWIDNSASVTVTNHSNTSVGVKVAFEQSSPQNGSATVAVNNPQFTLESAVNTSVANAPTKTATLTASGTPTSNAAIGKVKVTVGN